MFMLGLLLGFVFGVAATVGCFIYIGHRSEGVEEFITYKKTSDAKRRVDGVLRSARRSMNQATGLDNERRGLWEDML
jgi:hypothetical protein